MATSQLAPKKLNPALHVSLLLPSSEGFRVCFQSSGTGGPLHLLSLHDAILVVCFEILQFSAEWVLFFFTDATSGGRMSTPSTTV